jgi:hypothetical protein
MAGATHPNFQLFSFVEGTVLGTTPASALQKSNIAASPTIQRDRQSQPPDYVTAGSLLPYKSIVLMDDGTVTVPTTPLQYENLYPFHEGIMGADRASIAEFSDTDISCTSNVLNDAAGAGFLSSVGDCVYITFASAGDGTTGWYGPILAATTSDLTFPAGQISNFVAGNAVTINDYKRLVPGTTLKAYSIEHQITSLTTFFRSALYCVPTSWTFSWTAGANFATEEGSFFGKPQAKSAATIGTGGATAALTTDPLNSGSGVGTIFLAEATTNLYATATISDLSINIARETGHEPGLGSNTFSVAALGKHEVTGSMTMVLDDSTAAIIDEFEDNDSLWLRWDVVDGQSNRMCFFASAVALTARTEGDQNNMIHQTFDFKCHDPLKESGWVNNITGMPMFGIYYNPV